MPRFVLELDLGKVGMESLDDIAQVLIDVGRKLPRIGVLDPSIRDQNGNRIGSYTIRRD